MAEGYLINKAPQAAPDPLKELEAQRARILENLQSLMQVGSQQNPVYQQLQGLYQQGSTGGLDPYSQSWQQNQIGQESAAGNAQYQGQADMIRRAFANAGLSGGGLQAGAMADLQSRSAQQVRQARQTITSDAQLRNVQARMDYMSKLQALQQQQFTQQAQATAQDTATRSQFNVTSDGGKTTPSNLNPQAQAQQPAAQAGDPGLRARFMGANPFLNVPLLNPAAPTLSQNPWGGGGTSDRWQIQNYQQQQQAAERNREQNALRAQDWYNQQSNFFQSYGR